MKLKVDTNKCLGCGMCVNMCPEVFEFHNGKSSARKNADLEKNKDCITQAALLCPAQAIKIEK
ncbi:MAG: ferredoxin [Minisyncoccia bacterium]